MNSRKTKFKRIFAFASAFLIGAASLATGPNVSADAIDGVLDVKGLPDNAELFMDYADLESAIGGDIDNYLEFFYGEGKAKVIKDYEAQYQGVEMEEGSEEWYEYLVGGYDLVGIMPYPESSRVYEIYLTDKDSGEKVNYSGDGVTITYSYDLSQQFYDSAEMILEHSEREWYYAIVHVKDDGTREYLPATVNDGAWEFTTTSFSMFYPALVAVEEEGEAAPATLDGKNVYIGLAGVGAVSLFALGMWFARKERR